MRNYYVFSPLCHLFQSFMLPSYDLHFIPIDSSFLKQFSVGINCSLLQIKQRRTLQNILLKCFVSCFITQMLLKMLMCALTEFK